MIEYGIHSEAAGGVLESGIYTMGEAEGRRDQYIAEGEDGDDLEIVEVCPVHAEYMKEDCPSCSDGDDDCEHINQKFHGDVASCTDCGACPV